MAHDPETKTAVMAALLAGQGVTEVADRYDIPRSTVSYWKSQISGGELAALDQKKAAELGALIFDNLTENLITLRHQVQRFRDDEWLGKQNAESVAVLYGVIMDKTIRILGALDPRAVDGDDD